MKSRSDGHSRPLVLMEIAQTISYLFDVTSRVGDGSSGILGEVQDQFSQRQ